MTQDESDKLERLLADAELSPWEATFCDNLEARDGRTPGGYALSGNQAATLDRISEQRLGSRPASPAARKPARALAGMADMPMVVVYHNPRDHPGKYVARLVHIKPDGTSVWNTQPVAVRDSYEKVREAVLANLPGATRIPRDPKNDPVIMEIWL